MDREELLGATPENDGDKKEKPKSPLLSLEQDLELYSASLKEVSLDILMEGISQQPIFIAHQHEVNLGEVILNKDELNTNWTIHASTLEEFIEKGVVTKERKQPFLKAYKNPQEFMCVFVVVPEGANFIFYPYKK